MRIIIFCLLLLLMNCQENYTLDIQGHRGCRGLMPENTLPAFQKAIDLGVHTLELDVVITKDKKVVVSHEPYFNNDICRSSDGKEFSKEEGKAFNIFRMTYDEVKQFDCGSKQHISYPDQENEKAHKPLLNEVFQLAEKRNNRIKYNIELKTKPDHYGIYTPYPNEFVALVLEELATDGVVERTNLQSFDINILEEIKKQSQAMPIALLVEEDEKIFDKLSQLSFKPEIISPSYKLLDEKIVQNLQEENFIIIPWTVNEIDDLKRIISYNVDGIITDYPNRLLSLISK